MSPIVMLLAIFGAMVLGALLMLPLIYSIHRLMTIQLQNLSQQSQKMQETMQEMHPNLMRSLTASSLTLMTESQKTLLTGLLKPLLSHNEILLNRLLAREPMGASQLDASLVSREAINKEEPYILRTDEAEAERLEEMSRLNEDFSDDFKLAGWDSASDT